MASYGALRYIFHMYPFNITGVCNSQHLARIRFPTKLLHAKLESQELRKLRNRWYSTQDATPQLVAAVRRHCFLSGIHALQYYGAWVPPNPRRQIVRTANRKAAVFDGEVIKMSRLLISDAPYGIVPWQVALRHAMPHLELAEQVAVVEGLLKPNTMLTIPNEELLQYLGTRRWGQNILRLIDPLSESGLETVARVRLIQRGHQVQIQRKLPNRQRMDAVIDNCVALELDSKFHSDPGQYAKDNRKAIIIANQRLIPMRASFQDVMDNWDEVYRAIQMLLQNSRQAGS